MTTIRVLDCSYEYANYWVTRERYFVADFSSSDPSRQLFALQSSSGYFKIARSFGLSYDIKVGLQRLAPVLAALDKIPPERVTDANLGSVINSLRDELGR